MLSTLTYAVRVDVSPDQSQVISDTCAAYLDCCSMVSRWRGSIGRSAGKRSTSSSTVSYATSIMWARKWHVPP